jgi:hypothetical protein
LSSRSRPIFLWRPCAASSATQVESPFCDSAENLLTRPKGLRRCAE